MKRFLLLLITVFSCNIILAQSYITGTITNSKGKTVPFASVVIDKTIEGVSADENGKYQLKTNQIGLIKLVASSTGFIAINKKITITKNKNNYTQNFVLKEFAEVLNEITVTGTRTSKRRNIRAHKGCG